MAHQLTQFVLKSSRCVLTRQAVVPSLSLRCMSGANPQIKARQDLFQKDDDTPVHIKGGMADQVLYRATMGLCILGVTLFAYNMVTMATSKK